MLPGLLSGQDGLAKLAEVVLNQILEAQVSEALGAERHERSEERVGYRNGYRARTLYTRVGLLTLQVPQTREGVFSTEIFKRYQRVDRLRCKPEDDGCARVIREITGSGCFGQWGGRMTGFHRCSRRWTTTGLMPDRLAA